jgi:hypothetical protein
MTEITEAELFAEINALETRIMPRRFSDIEYRAIELARARGVSWIILTDWFNEKFGTDFRGLQLATKFRHEHTQYGCGEKDI